MPKVNTSIHLDMLNDYKRGTSVRSWVSRLIKGIPTAKAYGIDDWGDPDRAEPLVFIRDRYLLPFVKPDQTGLEIGPGGGRWTRYLLPFRKLYVVEYHGELLKQLRKNFKAPNIAFIQNNGSDFPGVPEQSIDFLFSFGVFVHLDLSIIKAYLQNMRGVLRPTATVVLQYSDKTKIMARENPGFSDNTPEQMREAVLSAGFRIVEEDLTTMWHSSLMRVAL